MLKNILGGFLFLGGGFLRGSTTSQQTVQAGTEPRCRSFYCTAIIEAKMIIEKWKFFLVQIKSESTEPVDVAVLKKWKFVLGKK